MLVDEVLGSFRHKLDLHEATGDTRDAQTLAQQVFSRLEAAFKHLDKRGTGLIMTTDFRLCLLLSYPELVDGDTMSSQVRVLAAYFSPDGGRSFSYERFLNDLFGKFAPKRHDLAKTRLLGGDVAEGEPAAVTEKSVPEMEKDTEEFDDPDLEKAKDGVSKNSKTPPKTAVSAVTSCSICRCQSEDSLDKEIRAVGDGAFCECPTPLPSSRLSTRCSQQSTPRPRTTSGRAVYTPLYTPLSHARGADYDFDDHPVCCTKYKPPKLRRKNIHAHYVPQALHQSQVQSEVRPESPDPESAQCSHSARADTNSEVSPIEPGVRAEPIGDRCFPCTVTDCNRTYKTTARRRIHIKFDHEGVTKPFCCTLPGCESTGFVFRSDLKRHTKEVHSAHKQFRCPRCQKSFARRSGSRRHLETVHGYTRVPCDQCSRVFKSTRSRDIHMQNIHEPEFQARPRWACPQCEKTCQTQTGLRLHRQSVHNPVRQYMCMRCAKTFITKAAWKRHAITHKPPQFRCPVCSKHLKTAHTVKRHIREVHTKAKPYHCDRCGRSFGRHWG
eukprot:375107_1